MSSISNKYINEAQKETLCQNPQSRWSTNTINMSMSKVKTQELSMCNQETSTHWSTHQMSHLLHLRFKLDPLLIPSGIAILWTPYFGSCVFYSMVSSIFIWKWFLFIKKKWLGVATYFCFIFKRVNKIRKKILSVTPYFGKDGLWKTWSSLGLLIGKVQ